MPYSVDTIADRFIELAGDSGLTHMQIQKLVYLAHELGVKRTGNPLVNDNPEVWQYGPVFPRLYHQLKIWKNRPIKEKIDFWGDGEAVAIDAGDEAIIRAVWNKFGKFSGVDLSNLTHARGTPWRNIAEAHNYLVPLGTEITIDDIRGAHDGAIPVAG